MMTTLCAQPAPLAPRSDMHDIPVIEFVAPMPGFPDLTSFALVKLDEDGSLCALRSLEDPRVRFLVVPPGGFFPGYEPEVDDEAVASLGIESVEDVLLMVVLNAGPSLESTTANLVAPVVVNLTNRRARQVILEDPSFSIAAPLVAA